MYDAAEFNVQTKWFTVEVCHSLTKILAIEGWYYTFKHILEHTIQYNTITQFTTIRCGGRENDDTNTSIYLVDTVYDCARDRERATVSCAVLYITIYCCIVMTSAYIYILFECSIHIFVYASTIHRHHAIHMQHTGTNIDSDILLCGQPQNQHTLSDLLLYWTAYMAIDMLCTWNACAEAL